MWYDTTTEEIKKFFGVITLMGLIFKPRLSQYWSTDELLRTPAFGEAFSRDRFMNLLTCLHLNNNETGLHRGDEGFDPLHKIRPIYDVLSSRFRTIYTPKEHICIDEAMVPWKGRLTFKQFIPNKPNRFGVKLYMLCESDSAYLCDFDVYVGADYEPDPNAEASELHEGHSYHVVLGLLRRANLLNSGYTVYVDNYYTSPTLCDQLTAEDTSCVGTVRKNRKQMPKSLDLKVGKGNAIFRQRENMVAIKWEDKREVYMLSSKHRPTMSITNKVDRVGNPVVKPTCIMDYNKHMGGVDTNDQLGNYYSFSRRTLKWWVKLFFYMFNLAVTNAYLIYKKNNNAQHPLDHFNFRNKLAHELIQSHIVAKPKRGRKSNQENIARLTGRHFPEVIPTKEGAKKKAMRKCVACNTNSGKRRVPGDDSKRKETRYWCPDCEAALCIGECFRRYHTLVHYKLNSAGDSDTD